MVIKFWPKKEKASSMEGNFKGNVITVLYLRVMKHYIWPAYLSVFRTLFVKLEFT